MMCRIKQGGSFGGALRYVLDEKKGAKIVGSDGIRLDDAATISRDFEFQAAMNPDLKKCVGHHVLSLSPEDSARVTDDYMRRLAERYLEKMGIRDTQYLIVRHFDKEHPHVHIIFNRVSNSGTTISDSNERRRGQNVCRDITIAEGLFMAPGKEKVNRNRLREPDRTRYRIFDLIKSELPKHRDLGSFLTALERHGVETTIIKNGSTDRLQGIRFKMGKYAFNGSKIDKSCSLSKICRAIEANTPKTVQPKPLKQKVEASRPSVVNNTVEPVIELSLELFQTSPVANDELPPMELMRRKKKKKKTPSL